MVLEDGKFTANIPASDRGSLIATSHGGSWYYKRERDSEGSINLGKREGDQK